jgi:hypothetical protein
MPLFSLTSPLMERAASEEFGSNVNTTGRPLDDVGILEERPRMVSMPHAGEAKYRSITTVADHLAKVFASRYPALLATATRP